MKLVRLISPVVRHYKGGHYVVVVPCVPVHDHLDSEPFVVYKSTIAPIQWWARPYSMFHTPERFVSTGGQHVHDVPVHGTITVQHTEEPELRYQLMLEPHPHLVKKD
jgi:hypothetical protein